jgi:hypothetical protein
MKKKRDLQQNLFDTPRPEAGPALPRNIRTEPLKPLLQALLTDLIAAPRPVPAVRGQMDEVES